LTNAEALPLTNTVFRAGPFFGHFEDRSVYQPTNGVDTVTNATMRARLLADAIPAQSYAAGRNAVPGMTNREMSGQFKDSVRAGILFDDEDDRKWVHSFFLRVPFSVVHDLFRDFVDQLPKNGDGR